MADDDANDRSDPEGMSEDPERVSENPEGTSEGSEGTSGDPEERDIEELREEIEAIDRELVELIARRTYVAGAIAEVKEREERATTDEDQEARVLDRAGGNAERFDLDAALVRAVFRLLIELSKIEQRSNSNR